VFISEDFIMTSWDPTKPRRGQNLFAKAGLGGWAEIIGPKHGIKFEVLKFYGGSEPQYHIVEFPKRNHVEFEFSFDIYAKRKKGDKQMIKLLITEPI